MPFYGIFTYEECVEYAKDRCKNMQHRVDVVPILVRS